MLIINQNYTKGTTDALRSKIRIGKINDMYCLLINDEVYAESEDGILIDILYFRLMQFKELVNLYRSRSLYPTPIFVSFYIIFNFII